MSLYVQEERRRSLLLWPVCIAIFPGLLGSGCSVSFAHAVTGRRIEPVERRERTVAFAVEDCVYVLHKPFDAEMLLDKKRFADSKRFYRYENVLRDTLMNRGARVLEVGETEPHFRVRAYASRLSPMRDASLKVWHLTSIVLQAATLMLLPLYFEERYDTQLVFALFDGPSDRLLVLEKVPMEVVSRTAYAIAAEPSAERLVEQAADEIIRSAERIQRQGRE